MVSQRLLRRGYFCPFAAAGFPEIAEAAFFHGSVRQLQNDLRRPTRLGLSHTIHNAYGAGKFVNHDFTEKTFTGSGILSFSHIASLWQKSRTYNV
jgi:hypothetical protein